MHMNAQEAWGGGGVGILVKDWILKVLDISVIDKSFDGILGLKLRHRHSEFEFMLSATRKFQQGSRCSDVFQPLLSQIYVKSDTDNIIVLGDFIS